jgi:23S rRNA (guanosine2251-2'-O)-methyltransferase
MTKIVLIVHDIRSTHNVGSLLRTADGLGVDRVFVTGYTPYPKITGDERLPHIAEKLTKQIHKTALGAENNVKWDHYSDIYTLISKLKQQEYVIIALEQHKDATLLPDFKTNSNIALLVGREVEGIDPELITLCDSIIEIPMFGTKESFNVVQAAAMALYHVRFKA